MQPCSPIARCSGGLSGLSDAPLSSGVRAGLCSGLFAAPHSAEDLVGYVEPVGSSGFAPGLFSLAFGRGGQLLPPAGSRC